MKEGQKKLPSKSPALLALKLLQNSQKKSTVAVSFSITLQASDLKIFIKKAATQLLCCEFCEMLKNNFFKNTFR